MSAATRERSVSDARDAPRTAPARCRCYGAFSALLASPHDVDVRDALAAQADAGEGMPFPVTLAPLVAEFAAADPERLKAEYSGLFEVGSEGPPTPIREDLVTGQKAGTREDIVRFYDFFGYRLDERFAWAPDHLSVQLEFMHFLTYHEAGAGDDPASYQLAQFDFADRHLANWVPQLARAVERLAPGSLYSRVLLALADFLARDLRWQGSTVVPTAEVARHG